MDSPAESIMSMGSDMTDEELDRYFASYVPLSNLPTPPPAKIGDAKPTVVTAGKEKLDTERCQRSPELEVYATHLANLVPSNASTHRPLTSPIYDFLSRASLPVEVIAFAACILDALSQRFAASWRATCLSIPSNPDLNLWQFPAVKPEIIVLSALSLAEDFLSDTTRSVRHWAEIEGDYQFTAKQINQTRRAILQDIDYMLARFTKEMAADMMAAMQRSVDLLKPTSPTNSTTSHGRQDSLLMESEADEKRPKLSLELPGTATWAFGQPTPVPTPGASDDA